MGRQFPYRVIPEETGGLGTRKAQEVVTSMLLKMGELFGVSIGPWAGSFDVHKDLGVINVKLEFKMWKTGWCPPEDALQAFKAKLKVRNRKKAPAAKPAKKKKPAKKAASRKSSKKAG